MRREQDGSYVILLAGNTQKDQIIRGLAVGADDYLTKPVYAGELQARLFGAAGADTNQTTAKQLLDKRSWRKIAFVNDYVPSRSSSEEIGLTPLSDQP